MYLKMGGKICLGCKGCIPNTVMQISAHGPDSFKRIRKGEFLGDDPF